MFDIYSCYETIIIKTTQQTKFVARKSDNELTAHHYVEEALITLFVWLYSFEKSNMG